MASTSGGSEGPSVPDVLLVAAVQLESMSPSDPSGTGGTTFSPGRGGELSIDIPVGHVHGSSAKANVLCKVHAPQAFKQIRESCGIEDGSFFKSLGDVVEIGNPGKGGQQLFRTADKNYFLKTMEETELSMLEHFLQPPANSGLPSYTSHIMESDTLLCAFVGWFSIEMDGQNTWLLAMQNLLPSTACGVPKLLQFDLKGSWYGRKASAHELKKGRGATLKDLDFWHDGDESADNSSRFVGPECLMLEPTSCQELLSKIYAALDFVAAHGVMDHSLLLGLYDVSSVTEENLSDQDGSTGWFATAEVRVDEEGVLLDGGKTRHAKFLIHCGVIDVLQTYNVGRKFQHHIVGAFTDVVSLSSVPAPLYRDRFKRFMELVVFNDDLAVPKTLAESLKLDKTNASPQASLEPVTLDKDSAELIQAVQTCKGQFISNIAELNNFVGDHVDRSFLSAAEAFAKSEAQDRHKKDEDTASTADRYSVRLHNLPRTPHPSIEPLPLSEDEHTIHKHRSGHTLWKTLQQDQQQLDNHLAEVLDKIKASKSRSVQRVLWRKMMAGSMSNLKNASS